MRGRSADERRAIQQWLDLGHRTSPMTNEALAHTNLTANWALRSAAVEWREASDAAAAAAPRKERLRDSNSAAPAAVPATAARPSAVPSTSWAPASAPEEAAAVRKSGEPLPLPDWASPGYRPPPVEQMAEVGSRAEVERTGGGDPVEGEAEQGRSFFRDQAVEEMDEEVDWSGRVRGEEVGPGAREGDEAAATEEPVVIEVERGGAGEDVEMADAVELEDFDDTQVLHWPRAPSHRISSRSDVERLPALA